jgi:hypothetical protein
MPALQRPLPFQERFDVPIYGAIVWVCVAETAPAARAMHNDKFGAEDEITGYGGMVSTDGNGTFGIFFEPASLNRKIIAHEVFHLTHRIMEWIGDTFSEDHHEPAAYLCGYLTERVYELAMGECQAGE